MKGLRTFLYELKYAFLQMKRHIMLCFSAISAIGITLLLIGAVIIPNCTVKRLTYTLLLNLLRFKRPPEFNDIKYESSYCFTRPKWRLSRTNCKNGNCSIFSNRRYYFFCFSYNLLPGFIYFCIF